MNFSHSTKFKKAYLKLDKNIQGKVLKKLELLEENENNPILNNHKLHGEFSKYNSINITGDLRIIYKKEDELNIRLELIGTHSQLYE